MHQSRAHTASRRGAPTTAATHHADALRLCRAGAFDAAIDHLESALAGDPARVSWARDLGALYAGLERWRDAIRVLEPRLAALDADGITAYLTASLEAGSADAALQRVLRLAVLAGSNDAQLLCQVGIASQATGDLASAERFLVRALSQQPPSPTLPRVHRALAVLYHDTNRGELSLDHARTLVHLRPESGSAHMLLAVAYSSRGRLDEARTARQEAVRLAVPPADLSVALKLMLMDHGESAETVLRVAKSCFAGVTTIPRRCTRPRPAGRLRVGYLGGEFRSTPNCHFMRAFLAAHDRDAVEVFLYNSSPRADAQTDAYRNDAEHWREAAALSDVELLDLLDRDRPDVLVDVSGHFPFNRLAVFARRGAPVQATFPNCPCTTGCAEMDYFLTDRWTSPEGSEREYSETLHRLEFGCLAYTPPHAPPLTSSPALGGSGVVFGVFQQNSKLSPEMWDAFAAVLERTPGSRLLLHNADAELERGHQTTEFMKQQFAARGVDRCRLQLVGPRPLRDHLDVVASVDVALDTWPYNGQTTTCECLWMGVPVVTRTGDRHVSRVAAGLLQRLGLDDLVATSADAYVETAVALARDVERLSALRGSLRTRMHDCGLTDAPRLARSLEAAYQSWVVARGGR